MLVQFVRDHDVRFFCLVVLVADFIRDLVVRFHAAQHACALIRRGLLLHRRHLFGFFLHWIFNCIQCEFVIVSDFHRRSPAAVHDLAFSALRLQRSFKHLHSQRDESILASFNTFQHPDDCSVIHFAFITCVDKLNVGIQFVLNDYVCCFCPVVLVADLIGNFIADFHSAKHSCTFKRGNLFLLWCFRNYRVGDFAGSKS